MKATYECVPLSVDELTDTQEYETKRNIPALNTKRRIFIDIIRPCLPLIILTFFISITILILTSGCFIFCYDDTIKVITIPSKTKNEIKNICGNKESLKTNVGKKACRDVCKSSRCCVVPIVESGSCLQKNEHICAYLFQYCSTFYYDDDDDYNFSNDTTNTTTSNTIKDSNNSIEYDKENNIVNTICSQKNLLKNKKNHNNQLRLKCLNECSNWSCCWEKNEKLNCYLDNVNECIAHMMCPDFR